MNRSEHFLWIGAMLAGLAVALGAFGAHGLKEVFASRTEGDFQPAGVFETAARYHMYHALGLMLVGVFASRRTNCRLVWWSGILFIAGIVLFSGSLYLLAITGFRKLGAVAPIGGTAFIVGWILLAVACKLGARNPAER